MSKKDGVKKWLKAHGLEGCAGADAIVCVPRGNVPEDEDFFYIKDLPNYIGSKLEIDGSKEKAVVAFLRALDEMLS